MTGLVGNTLHTDNQEWLRKDSGIGAGIDSFYEYLLKVGCTFCCTPFLSLNPIFAFHTCKGSAKQAPRCLLETSFVGQRMFCHYRILLYYVILYYIVLYYTICTLSQQICCFAAITCKCLCAGISGVWGGGVSGHVHQSVCLCNARLEAEVAG